ncbi:hypothetical protein NWP22_09875 [Anabaenopsis tanganyikae CS-531]|uniref:Uncharacterized protein n=2 Tax=Anabaenopsis TaxID=110103 RepID=A0ABT5ANJ0_9CYAN|nr:MULTISPECIES: hypothetical protein [Anabaenopsis]MDB9538457.1 hypothetical protein [Anabaenopsis arnoldii]MDH6090730.1 hypothetical protein [Anabaenopsis arnoldii]MDH6106171.1 hypothetical protein [Anabaenopsis tanganyikae CS-531]
MSGLKLKSVASLTLASALGFGVSTSQPVLSQEVIATSQPGEINSVEGTFSHSATDLQPIAQTPIDLNQFCRDYPLNSLCSQITPPSSTPSSAPIEVRPTEQTSQSAGGKKSGWAITPEIGTLGLGGSVTRSITPNFNARVGINTFSVGADITETDVTYEADLSLSNISTLVDYHPAKNSGFRLTGGLVFQDNKLKGTGRPTAGTNTITVGEDTYNVDVLRSVDAELSFANSVAPYLGIGWGNAVQRGKGLGFSFNLGVMFTGSPKVDVTPEFGTDATPDIRNQINTSIEKEKNNLENDLDWLNIYPVLSLGISYQF